MAATDSIFNLLIRVQANTSQAITALEALERTHKRVMNNMAANQHNNSLRGPAVFGRGGAFSNPIMGGGVIPPTPSPGAKKSIFAGGAAGIGIPDSIMGLPHPNDPGYQTSPALARMRAMHDEATRLGYRLVRANDDVADSFRRSNDAAGDYYQNGLLNIALAFGALITAGTKLKQIGHTILRPFKDIFVAGMKATASMEDIRARYETLFKTPEGFTDVEKVNSMLRQTRMFAVKTPLFGIEETSAAVVQLKAFGMDAFETYKGLNGEVINMIGTAGDLAATYHNMSLADAVTLLGELRVGAAGARRRMLTRGLQPLKMREFGIEHGFKGAAEFIDAEGKLVSGAIQRNTKEWERLFMAFFHSHSGGMMQKRANTLGGVLEKVKDAASQILTIGMGGIPEDLAMGLTDDQLQKLNEGSVFTQIKKSLSSLGDTLQSIIGFDLFGEDGTLSLDKFEELEKRLRAINELFSALFEPVAVAFDIMVKLFKLMVKFNNEHPKLFRMIVWGVAIAGVLALVTGFILTFVGFLGLAGMGILHLLALLGRFNGNVLNAGAVIANFATKWKSGGTVIHLVLNGIISRLKRLRVLAGTSTGVVTAGKGFFGAFLSGFKSVFASVFVFFERMIGAKKGIIRGIFNRIVGFFTLLFPGLGRAIISFAVKWGLRLARGGGIFTALWLIFKLFTFNGGAFSKFLTRAIDGFVEWFTRMARAIPGIVRNFLEDVKRFISSGKLTEVIEDFFTAGESSGKNPFVRLVKSFFKALPTIAKEMLKAGGQLAGELIVGLDNIISDPKVWKEIGKSVLTGVSHLMNDVILMMLQGWNAFVEKLGFGFQWMKVDLDKAQVNLNAGTAADRQSLGVDRKLKLDRVGPPEEEKSPAQKEAEANKDARKKSDERAAALDAKMEKLLEENRHLRKQMIEEARKKGAIELYLDGKKVGYGIEKEHKHANNRTHTAPVDNSNNTFR